MRFIAAVLLFNGIVAFGQDRADGQGTALRHRIGLAVGIGNIRYLDRNSSPLIYQSKPKCVRLFYNMEDDDFLFAIDVDVRVGGNSAKNHRGRMLYFREEDYKGHKEEKKFPVGGSFLAATVSLGAYYKLNGDADRAHDVALGGRIMNELFYPQGWTNSGMFNALSLAADAKGRYTADDVHVFSASAGLPVLTRLTRLPYHGSVSAPGKTQVAGFFRNSKWVGLAGYFAPAITAEYTYLFDSNWGAGIGYGWNRYSIEIPERMTGNAQTMRAHIQNQF